ncbi:thiol:disulfide interchange protein DsbA [Pasteurella langaaensis DSM 22999]|uniref:Thiol:disulfide interchange protein n=1 Tax=Alitibacter langaaensis DSM 22999 TaxID=1122935 RepID=A0A2U0T6M8_9PAST|nr:DsbA family protein [Pasteurella langaaensis]PVX39270.1 thiol:disulfide interchange protein DsbA [Pasteurella langaaensis DSM 22999]
MKKFLFSLVAVAAAITGFNAQAAELKDGEQYITLSQERSAQPEVIEFFSFYCPHCYNFEMQYKIPAKVKADLPKDATFKQYHVDFLGLQGANLTRAWALAMALGVEDKVKPALFEAAQANAFKSMDDIRQKFIDNGVTAEQFDGGISSFAVTALTKKQQNLVELFQVHGVPDFYVNNKFRVNPEGLSHDDFVGDYVKTVIELLKK